MEMQKIYQQDYFFKAKKDSIDFFVYPTCILSVIGSLLIISTYIFFRDLRTKVRLILLHLSIMDLGIGLANLIGTAANFNELYFAADNNHTADHKLIGKLCETQAFFATYSTYGSVFWTNCLAVYLYFAVAYNRTNYSVHVLRFCSVFCYIMPLILSLWLLFTNRLGPTPTGSGGWCAIIDQDSAGQQDYFVASFGYDFWIYLTFILVPTLFIGTRVHIYLQYERSKDYIIADIFWTAIHRIDFKFLLIPVTFVFLRMWTCIMAIISDYSDILQRIVNDHAHDDYWYEKELISALYYLSAIGDSAQGAVNGLIFVFLTKKVRKKLFPCVRKRTNIRNNISSLNTKKMPKYYNSCDTPPPSSL